MHSKRAFVGQLFAVVLLLQTFVPHLVECKPAPKHKAATIGGMALSGLAGMALGHAVSNHLSNKKQQKEEAIPPGCFKQTLREPDPEDPRKFIDTERLVCPTAPAPNPVPQYAQPPQQMSQQQPQYWQPGMYPQQQQQAPQMFMPQQQQPFAQPGQQQPQQMQQPQQQQQPFVQPGQQQQPQQMQQPQQLPPLKPADVYGGVSNDSLLQIQRPGYLQPDMSQQQVNGTAAIAPNGTFPQQPAQSFAQFAPPNPMLPGQPAQPGYPPQQGYPAQPSYPAQPGYPAQPNYPAQPGYPAQPNQYPVLPNLPTQPAQNNTHVTVLSKKTGYYVKSSSDKVLSSNMLLMLTVAFLLNWFH